MFEDAEQGVREALDAYPDEPAGLPGVDAAAGFAQLQRISELVEAKRLRWLADQDRRASYRKDGHLSTAAWLAGTFGGGHRRGQATDPGGPGLGADA
jgi:hypothetical protein